MEKCGTPFYNVDWLKGDLYAMQANTMTLIQEKASIMSQASSNIGMCPPGPSCTFIPSLGTVTRLTPLVAKSTHIPKVVR